MPEADTNTEFERLWEQAIREPEVKECKEVTKVDFDLSLDTLLKRYMEFAEKGVAENRFSHTIYSKLKEQTESYRKTLADIDGDSNVESFVKHVRGRIKRRFGS